MIPGQGWIALKFGVFALLTTAAVGCEQLAIQNGSSTATSEHGRPAVPGFGMSSKDYLICKNSNTTLRVAGIFVLTTVPRNTCQVHDQSDYYTDSFNLETGLPSSGSNGDIYFTMTEDSHGIASVTLNAPNGIKVLDQTRYCDVRHTDDSGLVSTIEMYYGGSLYWVNNHATTATIPIPANLYETTTFIVKTSAGRLAKMILGQNDLIDPVNHRLDNHLMVQGCNWSGEPCNDGTCGHNENYTGAFGRRFVYSFADFHGNFVNADN